MILKIEGIILIGLKNTLEKSNSPQLKKLEKSLGINQGRKKAVIICDSDMMETFDFSQIDADCVAILPAKEMKKKKSQRDFFKLTISS